MKWLRYATRCMFRGHLYPLTFIRNVYGDERLYGVGSWWKCERCGMFVPGQYPSKEPPHAD